jgi:hypothetical protein
MKPQRAWELTCQRCGHVALRYYADAPPESSPNGGRAIDTTKLRYRDGSPVKAADELRCSECDERHLAETFDPQRWTEVDPAPATPTHGHPKDSPHRSGGRGASRRG